MTYIVATFFLLLGAALGSFIQVVSDRYNTGLSFWKGRSFCFSCNKTLRFFHLIPLLSYLGLRGRCMYCNDRIPLRSFFIELGFGLISVALAYKIGLIQFSFIPFDIKALYMLLEYMFLISIFSTIALISMYDARHSIIPDSFLIVLASLSVVYQFIFAPLSLMNILLAAVLLPLPFLIMFFVSKGTWLGFGDVKYMVCVGFLLGVAQGLSAIILAFWIGAGVSVVLLALARGGAHLPFVGKHLTIKSEIPFGPFISLGICICFWYSIDLFHLNAFFNL